MAKITFKSGDVYYTSETNDSNDMTFGTFIKMLCVVIGLPLLTLGGLFLLGYICEFFL